GAVKAAAFVAVLRVLVGALGTTELKNGSLSWVYVLSGLSVLTMTVGNLAALRQENVKRLLAYSSIAHAGYLLVGVVAAGVVGAEGRAAVLYYLLAYTFTTIGAFGVVAWIGRRGDERLLLDDWGGLGTRPPAAALAMTIFLLSLGGIPPTAGFFGKFYIFKAALESSALLPLVVIAVLNSVISIYYYLKVVMVMYFREAGRETVPLRSAPVTLALVVAAFFVLQMGLQPGRYLAYAAKSLLGGGASPGRPDPARVPIDPGPRRLTPVFSEPSRRPSLAHGVLPMPCGMPRVLVADDEQAIRRALQVVLTGLGCEVVGAEDGVDALGKLRAAAF